MVIDEMKEIIKIREYNKRCELLFKMFDEYVTSCYWYNLPGRSVGYYDKKPEEPHSKESLKAWCYRDPDEFNEFFQKMKITDFNRMNKYKTIKYH